MIEQREDAGGVEFERFEWFWQRRGRVIVKRCRGLSIEVMRRVVLVLILFGAHNWVVA